MAVKRDENGRFLPGTTGNPKGRPKASLDEQEIKELITATLPEVIIRLQDLVHSENEAIALHAAIALRDWYAMTAKFEIPTTDLTSISLTYGDKTPTITVKNGDMSPTFVH